MHWRKLCDIILNKILSALEGAAYLDCEALTIRVLPSCLAIFDEDGQTRKPRGAGPASVVAARMRSSWGSQMDLARNLETAEALFQDSFASYDVLPPRVEAYPVVPAVKWPSSGRLQKSSS